MNKAQWREVDQMRTAHSRKQQRDEYLKTAVAWMIVFGFLIAFLVSAGSCDYATIGAPLRSLFHSVEE